MQKRHVLELIGDNLFIGVNNDTLWGIAELFLNTFSNHQFDGCGMVLDAEETSRRKVD